MKITLQANGSGKSVYEVTVTRINNTVVRISCSCTAGSSGVMCKHRTALLRGEPGDIFLKNQDFSAAFSFLDNVGATAAHSAHEKSLYDLEVEMNRIKKSQQEIKKTYARTLLGNVPAPGQS